MTLRTLYYSKKQVTLEITQNFNNLNLPMDNADFQIYKNSYFEILFQIKNNDRKPISLVSKQLQIQITNPHNLETILIKKLYILDATNGKAQFTLMPTETINLVPGYYRYSVIIINPDNTQNLLFVDQNQVAYGYFVLNDSALPPVVEATRLLRDDFYYFTRTLDPLPTYLLSKWVPGPSQKNLKNRLFTIAIYMKKFYGSFWIQATSLPEPNQADVDWYYVPLTINQPQLIFTDFSGIYPLTFEAEAYWIRFTYLPQTVLKYEGTEPILAFKGEVKQVLIKN